MTRRYVDEIIMKKPADKNSYLAEIPAVRFLEKKGSLTIDSDVTFFVVEIGRAACRERV